MYMSLKCAAAACLPLLLPASRRRLHCHIPYDIRPYLPCPASSSPPACLQLCLLPGSLQP